MKIGVRQWIESWQIMSEIFLYASDLIQVGWWMGCLFQLKGCGIALFQVPTKVSFI